MSDTNPSKPLPTPTMWPEAAEPTDSDTPETDHDRFLRDVERSPEWQAKQASIRRAQGGYPLNPWKTAPYGLAVVAIGLVLGWWFGWPKG